MTAPATPTTPAVQPATPSPLWVASLDLLRAEMASLSQLMPPQAPQDAAGAEAFEAEVDNIPV